MGSIVPGSAWQSSATLAEIGAWLRAQPRVIVLTHAKPDGDAVGSSLALVCALNARSPGCAVAHYFGPLPLWVRDVAGDTPCVLHETGAMASDVPADACAIVDTGSWTQLEPMKAWLAGKSGMSCIIDHHVAGNAEIASRRFIDSSAAAACEPVAHLCAHILGASSPASLPAHVAEALYLGLATDTGWFRHSNVSRRVMSLAGDLLDAGANHVKLYATIEQCDTPGRLRLVARALSSLDLRCEDRLALLTLTLEDVRQSGAAPGDTGGLTDYTQAIAGVQVSCVLMETPPAPNSGAPVTKVSLRSKPGSIDVNALAGQMGGGGHVRAAGAKLQMPVQEAKEHVADLVQRALAAL